MRPGQRRERIERAVRTWRDACRDEYARDVSLVQWDFWEISQSGFQPSDAAEDRFLAVSEFGVTPDAHVPLRRRLFEGQFVLVGRDSERISPSVRKSKSFTKAGLAVGRTHADQSAMRLPASISSSFVA
jgi:hypothetical protein